MPLLRNNMALLARHCPQAFEIVAISEEWYSAGHAYDKKLVDYLLSAYQHHTGTDAVSYREIDMYEKSEKILKEAERAKQVLSTQLSVGVFIEDYGAGHGVSTMLTRAKFEEINEVLFADAVAAIDEVLRTARIPKQHIDNVRIQRSSV